MRRVKLWVCAEIKKSQTKKLSGGVLLLAAAAVLQTLATSDLNNDPMFLFTQGVPQQLSHDQRTNAGNQ